jgi:polysaccharide deacetylase family protein (PEP-CTERM system associated)
MFAPVTFTFDLENHRAVRTTPGRYREMTAAVLEFVADLGVRGTFFVLTEVAEQDPALVREISERGHEVASHGYDHRPITRDTRERFTVLSRKGNTLLEDVTGKAVVGFRAPVFSLTPTTPWTVDVLHELGFGYSSSVLPASNPLFGFRGAPTTPFRWPNGLLELPVAIARFGPLSIPFLGGAYVRHLPASLTRRLRRGALVGDAHAMAHWTYCHPYEFDADEPFGRQREIPLWASLVLWCNRRGSLRTFGEILRPEAGPPLVELLGSGRLDDCPGFTPASMV